MSSGDFRLFVGLGNPGSKYSNTRHNIGFMALERLAAKKDVTFQPMKKIFGEIAIVESGEKTLRILMPNTFMNESGKSIKAALNWFNLNSRQILIIVDDMDIPLGTLRLRAKGSAGGHNGLKSAISHLGTDEFCRLRIGIGSPPGVQEERKHQTVKHVLGNFNSEEVTIMNQVLDEVLIGLNLIRSEGIQKTANRLNTFQAKVCE